MTAAANWELLQAGPADAEHTVLLVAGSLATAEFFADVLAEPSLVDYRLVAATLPGQGGTAVPPETGRLTARSAPLRSLATAGPMGDLGIDNYARLTGELAAEFGAEVLVGHSTGGGVVLETAAIGAHPGPLILLAPSLSQRTNRWRPGCSTGSAPSSATCRTPRCSRSSVRCSRTVSRHTGRRRSPPNSARTTRDWSASTSGST
jgi:pimeloyl-ACP methyl ester carboxylesterase